MADIKPRVGEIPEAVPLPHVSLGKNFFKVELLVVDMMVLPPIISS